MKLSEYCSVTVTSSRSPRTEKEILMTKIETLADAFYAELQDIYSAEQQLVKALPKMAKKASSEMLVKALNDHLEQSKEHIDRVAEAFDDTGKPAKAKKCEAMAGLIKECEEMIAEDADDEVADAMIIGLAQKIEHYEIATYGTLCTWANALGYDNAKKLLGQNLDNEEKTDKALSTLSKSINQAAKA
jgi:ferritin-like metal-binding protein YciE